MRLNNKGQLYVVVQVVLFALMILTPKTLLPAFHFPLQQALGFLLLLWGLAFCGAGIMALGRHLSALPHPKEGAELVQTGLYALVRHPIYSGLILLSLAWALLASSTVLVFYTLLLFVFFELKARREEQQLRRVFADYEDYQQRVKKLLPFIY